MFQSFGFGSSFRLCSASPIPMAESLRRINVASESRANCVKSVNAENASDRLALEVS